MIAAVQRDLGLIGEESTRLLDALFARKDETGEDQRLRALAAFGKAAFDDQLIGAAFPPHRGGYARAGCSATSRPSAAIAV
jgi:hypothetical protein